MRMRIVVSTLAWALIAGQTLLSVPAADAGPVNVDIRMTGYLPAPPGVHIYFEAGRPYYVENHRRVYIEKEHDHGRHEGHYKDKHHGRKNGHGKGHKHD